MSSVATIASSAGLTPCATADDVSAAINAAAMTRTSSVDVAESALDPLALTLVERVIDVGPSGPATPAIVESAVEASIVRAVIECVGQVREAADEAKSDASATSSAPQRASDAAYAAVDTHDVGALASAWSAGAVPTAEAIHALGGTCADATPAALHLLVTALARVLDASSPELARARAAAADWIVGVLAADDAGRSAAVLDSLRAAVGTSGSVRLLTASIEAAQATTRSAQAHALVQSLRDGIDALDARTEQALSKVVQSLAELRYMLKDVALSAWYNDGIDPQLLINWVAASYMQGAIYQAAIAELRIVVAATQRCVEGLREWLDADSSPAVELIADAHARNEATRQRARMLQTEETSPLAFAIDRSDRFFSAAEFAFLMGSRHERRSPERRARRIDDAQHDLTTRGNLRDADALSRLHGAAADSATRATEVELANAMFARASRLNAPAPSET